MFIINSKDNKDKLLCLLDGANHDDTIGASDGKNERERERDGVRERGREDNLTRVSNVSGVDIGSYSRASSVLCDWLWLVVVVGRTKKD